jgi:hypothetical protein
MTKTSNGLKLTDNDELIVSLASGGTVTVIEPVSSAPTLSNVASSATSTALLASNASRKGAMVFNDSTQNLFLKFGATASATSYTVKIGPAGYYEFPSPVYTGAVDGIWAAANGAARVTEMA